MELQKGINTLGRDFCNVVRNTSDDLRTSIAQCLSTVCSAIYTEFHIAVYWSSTPPKRENLTLSDRFTDIDERLLVKSHSLGSHEFRHFINPAPGPAKDGVIKKIRSGKYIASIDPWLKLLLQKARLPEELIDMKIQTNDDVFRHPDFPNLCCTPDGTAILDGVLCPVEIRTSTLAQSMTNICKTDDSSEQMSHVKSQKEKLTVLARASKAKNELRTIQRNARKKKDVQDPNYSPLSEGHSRVLAESQRFRSRDGSREGSLTNITNKSEEEASFAKRENRTQGQRYRRHFERLPLTHELSQKFLSEKMHQVTGQMFCMCAPKVLCISWDDNSIQYFVVTRESTTNSQMTIVSNNFRDAFV